MEANRRNSPAGDTKHSARDERGSMLIVALGILALLSIMAITFVKLMNLEQKATTNYLDSVKARLTAEAGLERSLTQLKLTTTSETHSDPDAPWIYAEGDYSLPLEDSSAVRRGTPEDAGGNYGPIRASFAGDMGQSYSDGVDRFKVKVVDTQTQFNLNTLFELVPLPNQRGERDLIFIRYLDTLGVSISVFNRRARQQAGTGGYGRNPIEHARFPKGDPNAFRGGEAIYMFRQSRENEQFNSKSELLEVLETEDDYQLVKDYVTTKSWFDPKTVSAKAAGTKMHNKPWTNVIVRETRSPINVNLATREVIAANLAGIAARSIFLYTGDYDTRDQRLQKLDEGTNYEFDQRQEETEYNDTETGVGGVIVYIDPFGYQPGQAANDTPFVHGAMDLADKIWRRINDPAIANPFRSFNEWEAWVDQTVTDGYIETTRDPRTNNFVFPRWDLAKVRDLRDEPLGATPSIQDVRRHPRFRGWFNDAVRSMIKANCNPNARLSSWNPDMVTYLPVDKGALLWRDPNATGNDPNQELLMRQTNEFCLSPKGIFEVTSLGDILGPPPVDVGRQQDLDQDGKPDPEIFAQAKVRGIIKLYEVETHRTQRDFESNGHPSTAGGYGDQPARGGITSYPIPKIYWDPLPMGYNPTVFYTDWENASNGSGLKPSKISGQLQLGTLTEGFNNTQVVEMGLVNNSVPPRFELLLQDRRVENPTSNTITDGHVLQADTSNGQRNNPLNPAVALTGRVGNPWGWAYGVATPPELGRCFYQGASAADTQDTWHYLVLRPDGYLNTSLRSNDTNTLLGKGTLLWFRASDSFRNPSAAPPNPGPPREVYNPDPQSGGSGLSDSFRGNSNIDIKADGGNVSPTNVGGVEFWYKPEFDWAMRNTIGVNSNIISRVGGSSPWAMDQRYCGLLGVSHVLRNDDGFASDNAPPSEEQGAWTRGTQMYVTKTTSGDLRITRLYFEVTGPEGHQLQELPFVSDPVNPGNAKVRISEYWQKCQTDPNYMWPPAELRTLPTEFARIRWARVDHWVDAQYLRRWRAHEWHHVAVRWDDQVGTLLVWLDGQPVPHVTNEKGARYNAVDGYDANNQPILGVELPSFVRLNAFSWGDNPPGGNEAPIRPKDQITIGSVWRDQAMVGQGLFKHEKAGVQKVLLPANGTVDDVRFYDGDPVATNRISYVGRYEQFGRWTNEFDLTPYFPKDSRKLTLGSIQVVAYLPRQYGPVHTTAGAGADQPVENTTGAGAVTMRFKVKDSAGVDKFALPKWICTFDDLNDPNSSSGFALTDDQNVPITVDVTDKIVYELEVESAKYDDQQGLQENAGASVATPVIDEVSLVWFLPNPKVLLKERVNN